MNITSDIVPEVQPGVFTYELYTILSNFESANLAQVKYVRKQTPDEDLEFNLWTKPDCGGTEFECNYKSWFYFAIKGGIPGTAVRLNLVNLNKQSKMYSQGMTPVFKVDLGKSEKPNAKFSKASWFRIKEIPTYQVNENQEFVLSFSHRSLENIEATTYYAFTYPYTYTDLCNSLSFYEKQFPLPSDLKEKNEKDIYFHRETIVKSLDNRSVDLLTISSFKDISEERECRLFGLFPDENKPRPYAFKKKKVVVMSARVHPGETPSSFVMNGLIKYLLSKDEQANILRQNYVFKLIPMLNPDGVARGFYRTDTRGTNLNRFYLKPSLKFHPTIYAARSLILYHHLGYELRDELIKEHSNILDLTTSSSTFCRSSDNDDDLNIRIKDMLATDCIVYDGQNKIKPKIINNDPDSLNILLKKSQSCTADFFTNKGLDSGLYLYVDFHGHASKKGIFMYGNHFDNIVDNIECMVYPKLMSINNQNFHYTSCNFSEHNMYSKDKKFGLSKEGSGRVAVLKYTGLIRSYTLECNYNTGRFVNFIPPTVHFVAERRTQSLVPPKFTPTIFEQVGKSLAISILDLSNLNPNSRLENSDFKSLTGLREMLRSNIISDCNRNRRLGSKSTSNINVDIPITSKQVKKSSISYDLMKPTTSKLLQPIMAISVTPKTKPTPLHKTIKKPTSGGIIKKNLKKRKMTASKQKAVVNTADNSLKLWCLEKKTDLKPLCVLGAEQWKKKK
ncbi:cytosolic carboxypeptidase-like protein 5 isoform X2 [Sipha flava]|uniref:Cytosolic carboxypeptidase-like protein 5 n=1 Tax=Sipha flava TaxID=143950 RepID=A0A8B8FFU5_9HEMI|nr:cytosolic carboxypeptidase-like protein 5 isoform X2 [Sipha flava]